MLVYQRVIKSSRGYTGCTVNYGTIHWGLILCSTLPGDQVTFEINTQTTHFKSEMTRTGHFIYTYMDNYIDI